MEVDVEHRANELYWGSSESVNRIAEELDLSKGALYEMIRPLPAGLQCPVCGAEVAYPNRTAKERGRVDCPACDWAGTEDQTATDGSHAESRGAGLPAGPPEALPDETDHFDDPSLTRPAETDQRRLVVGGALLGAAVGLALVIWARRR